MKEEDFYTWYTPIVLLVGAILSFADPITDILTLVEFYRTDHKTWFGVGLAFVILPCLLFPLNYATHHGNEVKNGCKIFSKSIICGFHPFSAALTRLQGFVFCLRKWFYLCAEINHADWTHTDITDLINYAVFVESVLESAPQFIIQLYAINVQEEPVAVIQIISLPFSFLSLAWAFTEADEMRWFKDKEVTVRRKVVMFVTHLFLLSSRLFAISYFTLSYKWWVIGVWLFHSLAVAAVDISSNQDELSNHIFFVLVIIFTWLRDDTARQIVDERPKAMLMLLCCNILTVLENFVMILLFYFSQHSNTWYSLPVTVCVSLFSVIGAVMRITEMYVFSKGGQNNNATAAVDHPGAFILTSGPI